MLHRWRSAPLAVTFTVYLSAYLVLATALALAVTDMLLAVSDSYGTLEVVGDDGLVKRGEVDSGPYIYDPRARELLPAAELNLPGDGPYAVFIATGAWGTGSDRVPERGRTRSTIYATLDQVREGKVRLYDWGLNFNDWYPEDKVLGDEGGIAAQDIDRYDAQSRDRRVQSVELFAQMAGADLGTVFGENLVSNTAYYAAPAGSSGVLPWLLGLATGLAPFAIYGLLGWIMFHHFYRVHIAKPLEGLRVAAGRIAGQDLDFSIERSRGRELGSLSGTLEDMRASLLAAQRELWRTAEDRRRLNAAFAHDLRTPVTVLKGTVEMAQMRAAAGEPVGKEQLDRLAAQVSRLERYAEAMGGLTRLEDRTAKLVALPTREVVRSLARHAAEVVDAQRGGLRLKIAPAPDDPGTAMPDATARIDLPLVEEVLDNLLSNACGHAASEVSLSMRVADGHLEIAVEDDGPGFSAEALHRGCEPFYSEAKSAGHFGVGLNVSSVLCALHGGSLELANREPHGACVLASFAL